MAKRYYGSIFRVPRQEPGYIATCRFCPTWSRFFPNRKRKKGSAFSRANRALNSHVRLVHPMQMWIPE